MQLSIVVRDGQMSPFHIAFAEGLRRHDVPVEVVPWGRPVRTDVVAVWGWRRGRQFLEAGKTVICMERGYLGDRFIWTSLGVNGLNGRGLHPGAQDDGLRFEQHFGSLLRPWRTGDGYALVIGQVATDAALRGVDIAAWYEEAALTLRDAGWQVRFRRHPLERDGRGGPSEALAPPVVGTLASALESAGLAVTFNSNAAVDAVLFGVPTISCDVGSMARAVTGHGLSAGCVQPERIAWARRLAWCQWHPDELASGVAWEQVAPLARAARERCGQQAA